jgi:hypothetical protein
MNSCIAEGGVGGREREEAGNIVEVSMTVLQRLTQRHHTAQSLLLCCLCFREGSLPHKGEFCQMEESLKERAS